MTCHFCELIDALRAGKHECLAELGESVVILADDQFYQGYCILILKDHHEHLARLPLARQARLWEDVARVAAAQMDELKASRINYECLGNLVNHIHWHIVPRYADDARAQEPIWLRPTEERRGTMSSERRSEIAAQLRRALRG